MKSTFVVQKQVLFKHQSRRYLNGRVCQRKIRNAANEGDEKVDANQLQAQYQQMMKDPRFWEMLQDPRGELHKEKMQDPQTQKEMKEFEEQLKDPNFVSEMEKKLQAMWSDPEIIENFQNVQLGRLKAAQKQNPQKLQKQEEYLKGGKQQSGGMIGKVRQPQQTPPPEPEEFLDAVKSGDIDTVDDFLVRNVNVMCKDEGGRTPLHYAVFYNHPRIVALLLVAGASVNAVDNSNNTPVHYACAYARQVILSLLLEREPDLSIINEDSKTALSIVLEDPRNPLGKDSILMKQMMGES